MRDAGSLESEGERYSEGLAGEARRPRLDDGLVLPFSGWEYLEYVMGGEGVPRKTPCRGWCLHIT